MQRGFIKRLGGQAIDVQLVGSATTLTNVPFSGQIDTSTLAVGVPVLVDIVNNQHVVLHTLIEAARNPVQPGQSTTSSVLNNALLADGTVPLTGNLPVAPGVTVDGYDISVLGQAISNLQAADTIARTGWTAFTHSTHLVSTISADATEILVRDAIFELNEQAVVSNTNGEIEFMQVTSAPTQALDDSGRICYRYTVTRRVGTSPGGLSTGWAAATLVNGLTKRGYITVDNRHVNSNNAPNITGAIWTDDPPTTTERVFRLGDLRGVLGITSNSFGFAVGALDTQNSYMLFNGADNSFLLRNAGIEILDDIGEQVVKIYGTNESGRLAGDYDFGKVILNRFVGETGTWGVYRGSSPIIEITNNHSFLRDLFTIGNPSGSRITLGELDGDAIIALRNKLGVAKLVARTNEADDVFFSLGNPAPQHNRVTFDGTTGRLHVDGNFSLDEADIYGRLSISGEGYLEFVDDADSQRKGVINRRGIVGYSVDALGQQYPSLALAWAPLVVNARGGQKTLLAGEARLGDFDYRHWRVERGPTGRAGLFDGDNPIVYVDYTGRGWFSGGGEFNDTVRITTGSLIADTVTLDNSGITIDALLGKFDGGGIRWSNGGVEYLQIGTQADLGFITSNKIVGNGAFLDISSDDGVYINSDAVFNSSGVLSFAGSAHLIPKFAVRTETASYSVTDTDTIIVCNKATAMTVTLPFASGSGRILKIKSIGIGAVTVDGNSTDTIDGQTTQTLTQWDSMTIVDYASNKWVIV